MSRQTLKIEDRKCLKSREISCSYQEIELAIFSKWARMAIWKQTLGSCKVEMTKRLRYVVENEAGQWCALLDFGYAALKNTALDEHIGWEPAEKKKRLSSYCT